MWVLNGYLYTSYVSLPCTTDPTSPSPLPFFFFFYKPLFLIFKVVFQKGTTIQEKKEERGKKEEETTSGFVASFLTVARLLWMICCLSTRLTPSCLISVVVLSSRSQIPGNRGKVSLCNVYMFIWCYPVSARAKLHFKCWRRCQPFLLLVLSNMRGLGHKMVVQSHTFGREGWTGADLKLGPSAYQPSTMQLAQTSTMLVTATVFFFYVCHLKQPP